MRALSLTAPRQFQWIDIPEPTPPGPDEAIVAIRAIGICGTDLSGYLGKMPFIHYPRILGHELGVEVLTVGENVTHLQPGDRCSVDPYLNCGHCAPCLAGRSNCCETLAVLGVHTDGGMTGRITLPAHKLFPSANLSFEQLALVETLGIGCHAVQRAAVTANDTVLIIGAGPIGLTVLEFARIAGATTNVLELNPTRRDFVAGHYPGTRVLDAPPSEPVADVIFDATGNPGSMAAALHLARFGGRVCYVGITPEPVQLDDPLFHRRELTLLASRNALPANFTRIIHLIESGKIDTRPWISHPCSFDDLPARMDALVQPESGVIKAVATL